MSRATAKRRPMLNEKGEGDPRNPENWGGPDALPGGKSRAQIKSTVLLMFERGSLDADQLRAAVEIERVFHTITQRLHTRSQNFQRVGPAAAAQAPEWIEQAYKRRYLPWTEKLNRITRGADTDLAYVIRILIDGCRLHEMDSIYKWPKGTASTFLQDALSQYVKLAAGISRRVQSRRAA